MTSKPLQPETPADYAVYASQGRWICAPHLTLVNRELMDLTVHDKSDILIIDMPPRHGKSEFGSKYFPGWYVGKFPHKRVIFTAYGAEFAGEWGRHVRDLTNEYGPECFGVTTRQDTRSASRWHTRHGGGMTTAGVGGPITGKGADLLIIDDPIKNAEEAVSGKFREKVWQWFVSTALTRLEPGGKIVIIMTRWHPDDLVGRLVKRLDEIDSGKRIRTVKLPAIALENDPLGRKPGEALWPQRYNTTALRSTRLTIGEYWWSAMFQQTPRNPEGTEWPDDYFVGVGFKNWPEHYETEVRMISMDPSKGKSDDSGDYSSFCVGYGNTQNLYVSCMMRRIPIKMIAKTFVQLAHQHKCHVGCLETNQFQELLKEPIEKECERLGFGMRLVEMQNMGNKIVRIRTLSESLALKEIRFREGIPGVQLLLDQLRDFPMGEFDDGPDSLEMIHRLWRREVGKPDNSGWVSGRIFTPGT